MLFNKKKLGLMQGRLSPMYNGKIQSFPKHHWDKEFKKLNKLGIIFLEWTLDHKELLNNPLIKEKGIKKIKKLKKKYNIKIDSLTGDCFMQKPFWKEKGKEKEKLINLLILILNKSKMIGISKIIIPLVDNGSIDNKHQLKVLLKTLTEVLPILKKNKQMLLFEVNFNPLKTFKFINQLNPKYFGINYDIGNSASLGFDPVKEINYYGKFIKNVHLKDRVFKGSTVRLGFGNASFDKVFSVLKKKDYKGNFILQTARSKNNLHNKEIQLNLDFLKKWF